MRQTATLLAHHTLHTLEGKVAMITGGSRGMGAAHVDLFLKHGAKVVFEDIRDDLGKSLAAKYSEKDCRYLHLDVTNPEDWDAAVKTTQNTFGKVNVLVNNAGIFDYGSIEEMPFQ